MTWPALLWAVVAVRVEVEEGGPAVEKFGESHGPWRSMAHEPRLLRVAAGFEFQHRGFLDSVTYQRAESQPGKNLCTFSIVWGEAHRAAQPFTKFTAIEPSGGYIPGWYGIAEMRPWSHKNWLPTAALPSGAAVERDARPLEVFPGDGIAWTGCEIRSSDPEAQAAVEEATRHGEKQVTLAADVQPVARPALPLVGVPGAERRDLGLHGGLYAGTQMAPPQRILMSALPLRNAGTRAAVELDVEQNGFGGEPTRWALTVHQVGDAGADQKFNLLESVTQSSRLFPLSSWRHTARFDVQAGRAWSVSVRAQNAAGKEAFTRLTLSPEWGCGDDERCCTDQVPKKKATKAAEEPPAAPAKYMCVQRTHGIGSGSSCGAVGLTKADDASSCLRGYFNVDSSDAMPYGDGYRWSLDDMDPPPLADNVARTDNFAQTAYTDMI